MMSKIKDWVSPLQVNVDLYNDWLAIAPTELPFTYWCLEQNLISQDDYYRWAQLNYGLALINDDFFDLPPASSLWQKLHHQTGWSQGYVPVAEWDGSIFIACTEPPKDIDWGFEARYLLATPKNLLRLWQKLQGDLMTGLSPEVSNLAYSTAETAEAPEAIEENSLEAPSGLGATSVDFKLDFPDDLLVSEAVAHEGTASHTIEEVENNSHLSEDLNNLQMPKAPEEAVTDPFYRPSNQASIDLFSKSNSNSDQDDDGKSFSITGNTSTFIDMGTVGQPVDLSEPVVAQIDEATNDQQAAQWAFQQLRKYFEKSIILVLRQNNLLQPWKWDKAFSPLEEALKPFDPQVPSLFRIVLKTKKPYHGFVLPSDLNDEFFRQWGYDGLPLHVTAVPIQFESRLIGVLLSTGTPEANTPKALEQSEKTALHLAKGLAQLKSQIAA